MQLTSSASSSGAPTDRSRAARRLASALAAALPLALSASGALAHAHLKEAIPAAGATVTTAPTELRLKFSEGVEPAFSSVTVTTGAGVAVPAEKPARDPADHTVLVVKLGQALKPGAYKVIWRAVSVDTHRTQGSFQFTVKP